MGSIFGDGSSFGPAQISPGPKLLQFSGRYLPGMSLDEFEDAFYEVAEPLFERIKNNWTGRASDVDRLKGEVSDWWQVVQVPHHHPVVGCNINFDPLDPSKIDIRFLVDTEYHNLHDEMVRTRPNRMAPAIQYPPRRERSQEDDGWDDDPLEL